jgi:ABC-type Mn2+/Zn2+ transport system ATPase subunit
MTVILGDEPLVRFEHVSCTYGAAPVVQDVSFVVREREFVGIVGPSGGGKTTVLRALLGSIPPAFGSIERRDGDPDRLRPPGRAGRLELPGHRR